MVKDFDIDERIVKEKERFESGGCIYLGKADLPRQQALVEGASRDAYGVVIGALDQRTGLCSVYLFPSQAQRSVKNLRVRSDPQLDFAA